MVFLFTGTLSSMRAFSSRSRIIKRECPSGAGSQAIWMMRASVRPSTLRRDALEFGLMLYGYTIPDIRLDDIRYRGRTDCIAVGNLGMGEPYAMNLVQFKEYLAPL